MVHVLEEEAILNAEPPRSRTTIVRTGTLLAERASLPSNARHAGYSPSNQIVFFFRGVMRWQVGSERRYFDANSALLVHRGEEFRADHPVKGVGIDSVIVTPSQELAGELFRNRGRTDMACPVSSLTQLRLADLAGRVSSGQLDDEELALSICFAVASTSAVSCGPNRRLVERTKSFLHAHPTSRLTLDLLAQHVGVSPIYLTQMFTANEGMPLYQYQRRLRLARSLRALPHCEDITALGLDLGFSSHSHFAASFRQTFGMSPSHYRATRRSRSS